MDWLEDILTNCKSAWGQLYQDEKELETYSHGWILTKLSPNLHLVIDQVQHELVEGYHPICHFILNGWRILLHLLVSALGNEAVAVRPDAVNITLGENETDKSIQKLASDLRQRSCTSGGMWAA